MLKKKENKKCLKKSLKKKGSKICPKRFPKKAIAKNRVKEKLKSSMMSFIQVKMMMQVRKEKVSWKMMLSLENMNGRSLKVNKRKFMKMR